MVTTKDVEEYVDALVFMPGWEFTWRTEFGPQDSVRIVTIKSAPMMDTSYPPEYVTPLDYNDSTDVVVDVGMLHRIEEVGCKLLGVIVERLSDATYWEHECREFFRIDQGEDRGTGTVRYHAPFHPHRLSGVVNWRVGNGG